MRVPWVKCLLFVFAACGAEATNCSSIKVPDVVITYWMNHNTDVAWLHTVKNANYTITGCCDLNYETFCSMCPIYRPLTGCHDDPEKDSGIICNFSPYIQLRTTVFTNLSIKVPGCPTKSDVSSLKMTYGEIKMRPVKNLSLEIQPGGGAFLASWRHKDDGNLDVCYFYHAVEILESGKRKKIANNEIGTTSVSVSLPAGGLHAYKLFEFCVKLRYCKQAVRIMGKMSDEKCVQKRLPPAAPSKPLKMLCAGNEDQNDCPIVQDKTERNVTLVWELPEKSSWNGLATLIKIKINFEGKDENDTHYRIINATNTNYTLTGLKLDGKYQIQLTFCSNGGDGPSTTPIVLFAVEETVTRPVPAGGEEVDPTLLIIIVVAAVVLIVVVVLVFIYLLLRSRRNHTLSSMPRLQPPRQGAAHSGTDSNLRTNPADYDFLMNSDEPQMPNKSSYEKLSCNGSNSSESTNDSATCPLVARTPDTTRDTGHDDVTFYPKKTGDESGSLLASGERTSDI